MKVTYDKYGRMNYCAELHTKTGQPWSTEDVEYLKGWYAVIGPEEMSFALERSPKSVMTKAYQLQLKTIGKHKRLKDNKKRLTTAK